MVATVDCREPYTDRDYGEDCLPQAVVTHLHGIEERYGVVGGVERGDGREDICVLAVNGMEDASMEQTVKMLEAADIAGSVDDRREAILNDIPRRRGGMDIIPRETYEIDNEESRGEAYGEVAMPLPLEHKGVDDWQRHPAEIEQSGKDVEHCRVVDAEILTWSEDTPVGCLDAEELLLKAVDSLGVYIIEEIVWPLAQ